MDQIQYRFLGSELQLQFNKIVLVCLWHGSSAYGMACLPMAWLVLLLMALQSLIARIQHNAYEEYNANLKDSYREDSSREDSSLENQVA
ncbi:MAG: hypothetical protein WBO36_16570 [Saprospiraceae bacterium]